MPWQTWTSVSNPVVGLLRTERGPFARLALFIRQVIAELRKVIWPTRKELIAYTTVVLFFVLVMAGIIAAYDYVFTEGVLFIFG